MLLFFHLIAFYCMESRAFREYGGYAHSLITPGIFGANKKAAAPNDSAEHGYTGYGYAGHGNARYGYAGNGYTGTRYYAWDGSLGFRSVCY